MHRMAKAVAGTLAAGMILAMAAACGGDESDSGNVCDIAAGYVTAADNLVATLGKSDVTVNEAQEGIDAVEDRASNLVNAADDADKAAIGEVQAASNDLGLAIGDIETDEALQAAAPSLEAQAKDLQTSAVALNTQLGCDAAATATPSAS